MVDFMTRGARGSPPTTCPFPDMSSIYRYGEMCIYGGMEIIRDGGVMNMVDVYRISSMTSLYSSLALNISLTGRAFLNSVLIRGKRGL